MKSYEILPAGMAASAKGPKSYEIMPAAGCATQGLCRKSDGCGCHEGSAADVESGNIGPTLSPWYMPFTPQLPVYGPPMRRFEYDPASGLVDPHTIPRLVEVCRRQMESIQVLRSRIPILRSLVDRLRQFEGELRDLRVNPNPIENPCGIFRDIHEELAVNAGRAVVGRDHATATWLNNEARDFHDNLWLMCDGSRGGDRGRAQFEATLAFIQRIIRNAEDSINDTNNELRSLESRYPEFCRGLGYPL